MIDANTNQQLEPKVVIAIVVPWTNGALDASALITPSTQTSATGRLMSSKTALSLPESGKKILNPARFALLILQPTNRSI